MEALGDSNNIDYKQGFFKYVFNFDDDNKNMLLNLFQYSFLSVPFIIIILKLINYYSPEEDDNKGSLEIIFEIITSISIILISIWFINKIIRYVPTYSKTAYAAFNETNFIIPIFIVLFTMQTKLGGKINILVDRLIDLYDGKINLKENTNKKNDYKTTQPISQSHNQQPTQPPTQQPTHQPSQADFLNQPQMQNTHSENQQQPHHNFNNAYQGPNNPLIDAAEPMAANEGTGGMFGGSLF